MSESESDWYADVLAEYEHDGAQDAANGTFDLPWSEDEHGCADDAVEDDVNHAYRTGWNRKRRELQDAGQ